jgi:hypothetical protein
MSISKQADCIRTVANWSYATRKHIYDSATFDPKQVEKDMEKAAPKMKLLFDKIKELDERDKKEFGTVFKHMIFTDVKSSAYGAKILASAFDTMGYNAAYDKSYKWDEGNLMKTKSNNFALLCSTTLYGKPMGVKFRKQVLGTYNKRPENIHGELLRFVILDQGFKEGIDLFDVKYVHLYEPLITTADEKQAIGRGTRFCGQKGLQFDPKRGWPLYVFKYEVTIPDDLQSTLDSEHMFELYLKNSGIDLRKLIFANNLEKTCIWGAIDYPLTRNVHEFSIDKENATVRNFERLFKTIGGQSEQEQELEGGALRAIPPSKQKPFLDMREYITNRFQKFTWEEGRLENQCRSDGGKSSNKKPDNSHMNIVKFSPTQDFVRNYFQPNNFAKGMLLWHSVGTGKTCTAIATASTSFEKKGYTILWVTRHTLKPDIWKNMYNQVCSLVIQKEMKKKEFPQDVLKHPLRHASDAWLEPISYKQFSNMLAGKNSLYQTMVKRNGSKDILKKTLIIIDEAHKLFASDVTGSERADVNLIYDKIHNSYKVSGKDSARVLLLTATPYTSDPMQVIKLLNLLREKDNAIVDDFQEFSYKYLDERGKFTPKGQVKFLNMITGYISYLNREKDARQFAYPIMKMVYADMTRSDHMQKLTLLNNTLEDASNMHDQLKEGKNALRKAKDKIKADTKHALKECDKAPKGKKKECISKVKEEMKSFEASLLGDLQEKMVTDQESMKELQQKVKELKKDVKDKKSDISQEGALKKRCGLKILE